MSLVASDFPAPDSPLMMMDWSARSDNIPRYDSSATWRRVGNNQLKAHASF
jgi:hypothetical protein